MVNFEVDIQKINHELEMNGLAILKPHGFFELCQKARKEYDIALETAKVQAPKKKFHYSDLAKQPWRKLTIGSQNGVGESYAQLLQTVYFSYDQNPYPALRELFNFIVQLRNQLMHVPLNFGENPEKDRFWNACRVHHYPQGGSFMVSHRDTHFPIKLGNLPFYQIMVPLSQKGVDFKEGGGFVITKSGEKINTDEVAGMGALIIFDGRIHHGVDDIDPYEILDFNKKNGRLAAFACLYATPASASTPSQQ